MKMHLKSCRRIQHLNQSKVAKNKKNQLWNLQSLQKNRKRWSHQRRKWSRPPQMIAKEDQDSSEWWVDSWVCWTYESKHTQESLLRLCTIVKRRRDGSLQEKRSPTMMHRLRLRKQWRKLPMMFNRMLRRNAMMPMIIQHLELVHSRLLDSVELWQEEVELEAEEEVEELLQQADSLKRSIHKAWKPQKCLLISKRPNSNQKQDWIRLLFTRQLWTSLLSIKARRKMNKIK